MIPSTDVIQITLTLKMTTGLVVGTSVTVNNNSPIQDYDHPDDQTQLTFEMTPGFKPFTVKDVCNSKFKVTCNGIYFSLKMITMYNLFTFDTLKEINVAKQLQKSIIIFSKIQLVVYYQCYVLIG